MITRKLDPWQEALLRELRTRDLSNERILELLAAVDAHCRDSAKTPQEAFGDPADYARIFAPGIKPVKFLPTITQGICGFAGLIALLAGVPAVMNESPASIRAGALVSLAAATVVFGVFLALQRHLAISAGALFLGAAALVLPHLFWPTVVAELPVWPTVTGGLFLLAVSWSVSIRPDHVVDPGASTQQILAMRWGLPAMLACAVVLATLRS